ncbi:MAG: hypothetical protein K8L97_22855 [Anaerolineae bacterium]|nr:hypothetical protein [Anaerolineae bacterium]
MKRLIIVFAVIVVLIIGGGLTSQLVSSDGSIIPGLVRQTSNPDASALEMVPWKAEQLFLFIGFIVFNLVGIAVTLAVIMWFLNWQVKSAGQAGKASKVPAPVSAEEG